MALVLQSSNRWRRKAVWWQLATGATRSVQNSSRKISQKNSRIPGLRCIKVILVFLPTASVWLERSWSNMAGKSDINVEASVGR